MNKRAPHFLLAVYGQAGDGGHYYLTGNHSLIIISTSSISFLFSASGIWAG